MFMAKYAHHVPRGPDGDIKHRTDPQGTQIGIGKLAGSFVVESITGNNSVLFLVKCNEVVGIVDGFQ